MGKFNYPTVDRQEFSITRAGNPTRRWAEPNSSPFICPIIRRSLASDSMLLKLNKERVYFACHFIYIYFNTNRI